MDEGHLTGGPSRAIEAWTTLSGLGSPVAIADVDEAGLKKTAASLPGAVLSRVLDVRDAADQLRFADEVHEWLPAPLAAVFNNAGVAVTSGRQFAQSAEQHDRQLSGHRAGPNGAPRVGVAERLDSPSAASPTRCARNCAAPASGP